MAFQLKGTETELGSTPIENIFIDQFLPFADGIYIKVYLTAYKYALSQNSDPKINHQYIAKVLGVTLIDVLNAWEYWERMGVIEKKYTEGISEDKENINFDIIFLNLTELYTESYYANKFEKLMLRQGRASIAPTSDDLIASFQNPALSKMFKELDDTFRRSLSHNERLKILDFIEEYGMDPEVVSKAAYISTEEKGIRNIAYALGILRNWHGMGVRNFQDLENMLEANSNKQMRYIRVKSALGASNKNPTPVERTIIDRWFDEWNYSMELVMKACAKSANTTNPSVTYINGIISDWNDKNLRTVEQIDENEKLFKQEKAKNISKKHIAQNPTEFKTKFHNFPQVSSQYTDEELENIWRKKK